MARPSFPTTHSSMGSRMAATRPPCAARRQWKDLGQPVARLGRRWRFVPRVTYLRDQFLRDTQIAMGPPGYAGTFVHLYINGLYWGLYNPVERPGGNYAANHFGGSEDDYDFVKWANALAPQILNGDLVTWNELVALTRSNPLGNWTEHSGVARCRQSRRLSHRQFLRRQYRLGAQQRLRLPLRRTAGMVASVLPAGTARSHCSRQPGFDWRRGQYGPTDRVARQLAGCGCRSIGADLPIGSTATSSTRRAFYRPAPPPTATMLSSRGLIWRWPLSRHAGAISCGRTTPTLATVIG